MFKNKKIYIVFLILILCVVGIYTFEKIDVKKTDVKKEDTIDNGVAFINIFNGNTGKEIEVDNKDDINKILENLKNIEFIKDGSSKDFDGYSFSMNFYDTNMNKIDSVTINSTDTIIYKDYFYKDKSNSIDNDFIKSLFSKYSNN